MLEPTPYPEVNAILKRLLADIKTVLDRQLIGLYLDGSLTSGDFDQDSDIDFVAVTETDLSEEQISALQEVHAQIAQLDTPFSDQLEGSYLSQQAIRRFDPAHVLYPNLERGKGEQLKMSVHDEVWAVHRSILRERGIVIVGPPLSTLIDPVAPAELRQAMKIALHHWAENLLANPAQIPSQGYQSYIVLALCRILYTLEFGKVASKPAAAHWAGEKLSQPWSALIDRAWIGRHHPSLPPDPTDLAMTLNLIRYTISLSS